MFEFSAFFFFFFSRAGFVDFSTINSAFVHCSQTHKHHFSVTFFIKNGSHGTIYIFKNYFVTVFSGFSFQFQQNKFYLNRPLLVFINNFFYIFLVSQKKKKINNFIFESKKYSSINESQVHFLKTNHTLCYSN